MSDYDYGRENGLWGNDGIPYGLDRDYSYSTNSRKTYSKNFNRSEQLALNNGFQVVLDGDAYNGRYFIKDGKKWIHNLSALKRQMGTYRDNEVESMGYDVAAYYATH